MTRSLLSYSCVLLDFDGLLVDTEAWHFAAYKKSVESFSLTFKWDYSSFLPIAHESSESIKLALHSHYPELFASLAWKDFYKLKSENYCQLIESATISFMPGADKLLQTLIERSHPFAIVTNSSKRQIELIKHRSDRLMQVANWFVREDYDKPKPAPDGYLKALSALKAGTPTIGFEDTKKGIHALQAAHITPVLICHPDHPQRTTIDPQVAYFPTLTDYLENVGF